GQFPTSPAGDSFVARWTDCPPPFSEGYCFGSSALCPCNNDGGANAGCANSTLLGATIDATGSGQVAFDDMGVDAVWLVPNQPALLFSGSNAVNGGLGVHFGDGLRCTGGNVTRYGV